MEDGPSAKIVEYLNWLLDNTQDKSAHTDQKMAVAQSGQQIALESNLP